MEARAFQETTKPSKSSCRRKVTVYPLVESLRSALKQECATFSAVSECVRQKKVSEGKSNSGNFFLEALSIFTSASVRWGPRQSSLTLPYSYCEWLYALFFLYILTLD
jgi:hypothetical protein